MKINVKKVLSESKNYPFVTAVVAVIIVSIILTILGYNDTANILMAGFSLLIAAKLSYEIIQTLREGRYGVDILAVTAIVSTIVVGEYWASIVIVLMLTSGEALEDYAAARAKRELSALLERAPKLAHVIRGKKTITVPLSEVRVGNKLLIKPGEVVPVDAELLDQIAEFDESSLTGESLPVTHKQGETILSGSINGSSAVTAKALNTAENSQYQQIIKLVKSASSAEAPFVRMADRYAVPFTIVSFAIAGLAWGISGEALRFAQVLVVATPCPLLLGAPIALISGMSRSAKHGIIVKGGGVLEKLATIKAVAFDKTGTLTHGQPAINSIIPAKGFKDEDVLKYAASAEQFSSHVFAQTIVEAAKGRSIKLIKPKNVKEVTASGVTAEIKKQPILVGKYSFLISEGIPLDNEDQKVGETAVYVAFKGEYVGAILFRDQIREEAKSTIQDLYGLGVKDIMMLTGDSRATAERIAQEVGITDIKAECLPIDKVNAVRESKHKPILMVGDGVNDAPVLAVADVGMAMGARGSTVASETADVVVLVDDISKTAQATKIAKDTIRIALQSIWIGIAISVILMLIASTGAIPAVVGAALQEVVDVVVIINALRAHGSWTSVK